MANRNLKAQIAVIITLVIAAIFLFVVVFINLAKLSNIKTLTSQVADRSALQIASQIGSMSHNFQVKLDLRQEGDEYRKCDGFNWVALGAILSGILIAGLTLGLGWPISVFLFGVGLASLGLINTWNSSLPINKAIYDQFKGMTTYNGTREATLYQALSSLQTDDTLLRPSDNGVFFDDIDQDTVKDPGEPEYNLSSIEAIKNAKKTGRFFAWYYARRLPLVSEERMQPAIDAFLNNLRNYIEFYEWDQVNWIHRNASFVVEPVNVTCSSCPSWVYDAANGRVSALTIDGAEIDENRNYIPSGFLKDKFLPLAKELDDRGYELPFCENPWYCPEWAPWNCSSCGEIDDLIEDLNMLVARTKELVDLPVSLRFQGVSTWLPYFYDLEYDRSQSQQDGYKHDIYDRLTRDEIKINDWITNLNNLNDVDTSIRNTISVANGHNEYGLGGAVSSCATEYNCCASDCTKRCCENSQNCSFQGIYCSACGSSTPPVCVRGDLYGAIPSWCPLGNRSASCDSFCASCSRDRQCPDACNFQGQLANDNPSGPTEVAQAIEILERLLHDIGEIKSHIEAFAREASLLLPKEDVIRNEIVYAWTDKENYSHLVAVRLTDYPERLPYVTEERAWGIFQKCRVLRGGANDRGGGDLRIITWRYDEDRPTPWWLMRLRKTETPQGAQLAEFDKERLRAIVQDIQDNGILDSTVTDTVTDVENLLSNYAITSTAKVEYGPEKENIKIVGTTN